MRDRLTGTAINHGLAELRGWSLVTDRDAIRSQGIDKVDVAIVGMAPPSRTT